MQKRKKPTVAAIYALGLTVLVYSLLFPLEGFGDFLKCALLAWAVYALVGAITKKDPTRQAPEEPVKEAPEAPEEPKKPKEPDKPADDPALAAVLEQGQQAMAKLQALLDGIRDYRVSAKIKQIEALTGAILRQVERSPDKLKAVRQFMNYYLPTTLKLLEQYVQLQDVGLKGENIQSGMAQIEALLDKVIVAFQKQLDGLFAREVVDITADIRVMEQMMAQNGLTDRQDFRV